MVKLLFFDDFKLGILKGETVIDVSDAVRVSRTPDHTTSSMD
jgi:hypothetical protein